MIELKNVSKYYTNNGVVTLGLRNINLKLNTGEIVAITGDSGSGKSTLLNVITAVDTYEEGEILFEGNETSYFNQNDMDMFRKNNVSFIFQNYNIIDSYTVLENVMLPLLLSGHTHEDAKTEAKKIIEKVGLSKRINHRGTKLSGGEKQRCVIARALASDSKILACDEPTGNLDSETGEEIIKLIAEVAKDKLVLIVTHNYAQVSSIATRRIKISDGEVIEDICLKEAVENDQKKVVSLSEQKVKKSIYLKLALQNIFSTPKKTIFSLLVFLVISFISLLLYLMMLEQSYDTYSSVNEAYSLKDEERLIVYNRDHSPLHKETLEQVQHKEIYYNAFYEETNITIRCREDSSTPYYVYNVKLTYHELKHELISGNESSKEGEYLLVFPEHYYAYDFIQAVNKNVFVSESLINVGKIVGVGTSDEITSPYLLCYETFHRTLLNESVYAMNLKYYLSVDQQEEVQIYTQVKAEEKSILCLPLSYQNKDIKLTYCINNLYSLDMDYVIQYDEIITEPILYIGNMMNLSSGDKIYEAVIYTNQVKLVRNQLEQAGYMVSVPSDMKVDAGMFNLAVLYLFLALVILALICLFFISYIILARIYASKNKDYGVLRTLGMVKKQLGRIVILEVMATGFLSSIFALLIFLILYHTTSSFGMGDYLNIGTLSLYFISMIIFSFFIAKRFNRRLFKFSVNTTMKGEVARND
ncbi:MAG: ABC transporter ATP-binding protein/permease [Anaeroplasmataceae bacterium]|nr:ABC transporter ATP-binding protein/permease [Anaeroplasmataceae bacterium]